MHVNSPLKPKDWEHVTVRLDSQAHNLLGIWYNSHRNVEGEWRTADRVPRQAGSGRPIVYVALNGHGTYPEVNFCSAVA